nr:hypothetical protein B0A51_09235 [Rachicladosporium sp. CCFEE 5018]
MDASRCAACGAADKSFLSCAKCKITKYCVKTCQTSHWKSQHKKERKILARGGLLSSKVSDSPEEPSSPPQAQLSLSDLLGTMLGKDESQSFHGMLKNQSFGKPTEFASSPKLVEKPITALQQNKFLHNLPQATTYRLFIDCLRMRQEDTYSFAGDTMVGTIYNSEPSSVPAFRKFIAKAEKAQVLPPWWKDSSIADCLHFSASENGFSLGCAQEKADIQET